VKFISYKNRFSCPPAIKKGAAFYEAGREPNNDEFCAVAASMFGFSFDFDIEGRFGMNMRIFKKEEDGSHWQRDTWFKGPPYNEKSGDTYHLCRVVGENGKIDEGKYEKMMQKADGQPLAYWGKKGTGFGFIHLTDQGYEEL
jgi:hypothetical protein